MVFVTISSIYITITKVIASPTYTSSEELIFLPLKYMHLDGSFETTGPE